MDKKRTGTSAILLGLSVLLAACDAVTAQHIPSTTSTAYNNGAGIGGANARIGMPGGNSGDGFGVQPGGMPEAIDADLIGRIAAVNGDAVTLVLLEQGSGASGDGASSPGGSADGRSEWIATGEQIELALGGAEISSGSGRRGSRSGNGAATVSDLAVGQIVMVRYKSGTETAERIRVLE